MNIIQELIPASNTKTRPGIPMVPKYLTIHETDNTSVGADAAAHARLQVRGNDRTASWHLTVDGHEMIQSIPFDEVAWAAGDGPNGPGNRTSIHIEMCVNADGSYGKTVSNTVELVQYLMGQFNIPIDHVVPHKHWSGKNCPRNLLPHWDQFIKRCQGTMDGWVKKDGQWYFYQNEKKRTGWVKDNSKWYYLDANGVMQTGWAKVDGKWYFLSDTGVMQTGWVKVNNKWYYFNSDGSMRTGWLKFQSRWYFMKPNGEMAIGWIQDKGKWYYLNPDGSMITGTYVISGKQYTFGSDGALVEENNNPSPPAGNTNGGTNPPTAGTPGNGNNASTGGNANNGTNPPANEAPGNSDTATAEGNPDNAALPSANGPADNSNGTPNDTMIIGNGSSAPNDGAALNGSGVPNDGVALNGSGIPNDGVALNGSGAQSSPGSDPTFSSGILQSQSTVPTGGIPNQNGGVDSVSNQNDKTSSTEISQANLNDVKSDETRTIGDGTGT